MTGQKVRRLLPVFGLLGIAATALSACGDSDSSGTIDVRIVEREDFTYSAGYSNGCRFKVQVINNTDMPLNGLDVFILDQEDFLFSISSELPVNGASIRTHDVQQNKRCNEFSSEMKLRKNHCTLGALSETECFDIVQIVPPE